MGKKNRRFIDKRYDTIHSFKVVQRSQKDPLVADETAPQAVLVDAECSEGHEEELHKYGVYFDDNYDYLQHLRGVTEAIDGDDCELEVYTIRKEDPKLNKSKHDGLVLPSSAFESYVEEPIGLLNKAAPITGPRLELDPDIVAELDSDEERDYCGPDDKDGLPDDFVSILKGEGEEEEDEETEAGEDYDGIQQWLGGTSQYYEYDDKSLVEESLEKGYDGMPPLEESYEDEYELSNNCNSGNLSLRNDNERQSEDENEEVGNLPGTFRKKKPRTNSTSRRSTSSSTLPRTELQRTFDAYFERLYIEEYSEDKIGALEGEIIEGPFDVNSEVFLQAFEATKKQFTKPALSSLETEDKKETVEWTKNNLKLRNYMQGEKEEFVEIEMEPKLKYDLEGYLASQARARARRPLNLPHVIDDRVLNRKSALTKKAIKEHNQANEVDGEEEESSTETSESEDGRLTLKSQISIFSQRPKNETPDERRDRKKALKELRKVRREEKKLNKLCFKEIKKAEAGKHRNKGNARIITLTGLV